MGGTKERVVCCCKGNKVDTRKMALVSVNKQSTRK